MTVPVETVPPAEAAHVLLVEDDNGMRVLVARILCESGYRATGTNSAATPAA